MFIVKVPGIEGSEKTKGCKKSPNKILEELKNISSNESGKIIDAQLLDIEEIHLDDNFETINGTSKNEELIYKNAFEIFEEKPKVVFLGGDNSINYSLTRSFLDYCESSEKQPCLIVLGANANCCNSNKQNWIKKLIQKGFPSENILLVGARNFCKEEIIFLKEKNIRIISMNQFLENLGDTCEIIMEFSNKKELYISIDINFIEPAFAPATDYPESGGLSSREFIYLIQRMNKIRTLRAINIVGINSDKDKENMTIKLAAKILGELI